MKHIFQKIKKIPWSVKIATAWLLFVVITLCAMSTFFFWILAGGVFILVTIVAFVRILAWIDLDD